MNNCSAFRSSLVLVLLLVVMYLMAGCSANFNELPEVNLSETRQVPIGDIHGSTFGGQQPIYQSRVYLMAASNGGYGTTSVSLLQAASNTTADGAGNYYVTTDGSGNFNITGDYTCTYNVTNPSQSQQLYILSLSGNATYIPGTPPSGGTANPYIGLMAVLGACPSTAVAGTFAGHISYIFVNEVSTVAAAYALAGFASGTSSSGAIGSPPTSLAMTGLANAFANANQLYDIQGSSAAHEARLTTPNGNGAVPYKLIDTMANILAACINSNNTATIPATGACNTLYTYTGNSLDTASAMLYIAQHPAANVSSLYGLAGSSVQFIDSLSSVPKDFTAGVIYTGTGLSNPVDVAIDASGDAWVTSSSGTVSNLTPLGVQTPAVAAVVGPPAVPAVLASPYTVPTANYVAIDSSGNAWVTSKGGNKIYEFASTGAAVASTPYTNSDFSAPAALAINGTTTFLANSAGTKAGASTSGDMIAISGTAASPSYLYYAPTTAIFPLTVDSIPGVSQIAVDSAGFVWGSGDPNTCALFIYCAGANLVRVSGSTMATGTGSFTDASGAGTPQGVAIDSGGNGWIAAASNTLYRVTATNAISSIATGGLSTPFGVAIDGSNNVWVTNTGGNSVSEFAYSGSAITATTGTSGDAAATLTSPTKLDIDESGDVWIVNSTGNSVTELIGSATPVVRPLATAVANSKLGTKP